MSGEDKLSGVAQWARLRIDWVQAPLPLERARLPCGNTYHNVCNQIDLTALNQRAGWQDLARQSSPGAGQTSTIHPGSL
jgi:hypothetical protein